MTIEELNKLSEAFASITRGEEWEYDLYGNWLPLDPLKWSLDYLWKSLVEGTIRPKPKKKMVNFGPTDVWGKLFRRKGIQIAWSVNGCGEHSVLLGGNWITWDRLLEEFQCSTDGGITWKPCWKEGGE